MMRRLTTLLLLGVLLASVIPLQSIRADDQLVAALEALNATVSVKRANTTRWVDINKELLVGVGDSIRTGPQGRARITFFADGTETDVLAGTEFRIDEFTGDDKQYKLSVTVVVGQTRQRVEKLLDQGSSYTINSNGLEIAVRGTQFAVRVEESGRSATIVEKGAIQTTNPDAQAAPHTTTNAEVPAGMGIRAERGQGLSDVVAATNFAQLDAALDGCQATVKFEGDVRLNLRTGPDLKFPRVGSLDGAFTQTVVGVTQSTKWYRIAYKGGYAWFNANALILESGCVGLRKFDDSSGPEDTTMYVNLDPDITLTPSATVSAPTPTATATQKP